MPEDHTPDNHPPQSLLGLPDYVPLSKAAELLGLAPRDLFEHAKKIPIYGKVLKLIKEPPVRGKLLTMEELRELAKSTPANDVLSILSGYRQEFLPPKRLDPDFIHTLQSAPQDWALLKTEYDRRPGYPSPSQTTWLLLHCELSVRGEDLQRVIDDAKAPPEARDEPQTPSERGRKVADLEEQIHDLRLMISVLWEYRDRSKLKTQKDLKEYLLGTVGVKRGDTSLERLLRAAINSRKTDK